MQITAPDTGTLDDEAREVGLRMIFRHGMEAGTIVRERITVALRSRDAEAAARWQAVAEVIEQATRPPHCMN